MPAGMSRTTLTESCDAVLADFRTREHRSIGTATAPSLSLGRQWPGFRFSAQALFKLLRAWAIPLLRWSYRFLIHAGRRGWRSASVEADWRGRSCVSDVPA